MRLTLRTLLAYLDDTLDPAHAREIGEKINESEVAKTLINRIREVMRRRRLTAPALDGPEAGVDPNKIAEYLDSTISSEGVADIERICLASDVHLTEVAACHQILTLVLGEPVETIPESRERMYALGPLAKKESPETAAIVGGNGSPEKETTAADDFQAGIPEYLKRPPLWKRAFPYAVYLLLIGALMALILTDQTFLPGSGAAPEDRSSGGNGAQLGQAAPIEEMEGDADQVDEIAKAPEAVPEQEEPLPAEIAEPESTNPAVPPEPPPAVAEVEVPATPEQPATTQPPAPVVAQKPVLPEEPVVQSPPVQYLSPTGILLRYDDLEQDWFVLPPRSIIHSGDQIASPEPFDAELDVGKGLLRATVLGHTAVRLLPATPAAPTGLAIRRGRVLLRTRAATGNDFEPVPVAVAVGEELWRIEILENDTVCGIEIIPAQPNELEQPAEELSYSGGLFVLSGAVRFSDGGGRIREVRSGPEEGWISLSPADREAVFDPESPAAKAPLLTVPQWLDPASRRSSPSAHLFLREFPQSAMDLTEQQGMLMVVPAIVSDDRPRISELAVKCLAVTEAAGWLVKALVEAPHEESRAAAVDGLRTWLPTHPENGEILKEELKKYFLSEADVEAVYRLLWGFNRADAQDQLTSNELVEWLNHDSVVVRHLAFYHVYRLTGRKYDYRPILPPAQRRSSVNRWYGHLENFGALIAPDE